MANPFPPELAAILGIFIAVMCGVLLIVLVLAIFYLLTLQKALNRVSPHNRLMEPAMVWLMLIPLFNEVWQFFIAYRVPGSLQNEFQDRNRDDGSDYGKTIALTRAYLSIFNIFLSLASNFATVALNAPELGLGLSIPANILGLVNLILLIIFWVKIANYSNMLAADEGDRPRRERNLDDYDDDDDRDGMRGGGSPPPESFKAGDAGRYQ